MFRTLPAVLTLSCLALAAGPAGAVSVGQADTFEDGTTQGWQVALLGYAHPAPPANLLGGPGGTSDHFLMLTSVGGTGGAGSRMAAVNPAHWGGNYTAAGVTGIRMDLRNFGSTDLALRVAVEYQMFGQPFALAFSKTPVWLPAQSGWTTALFPLAPSALGASTGTVAQALANAQMIRLYHSPAPEFPPSFTIAARLGVDNVTAVPEPASAALLGLGALTLAAVARRRQRRAANQSL